MLFCVTSSAVTLQRLVSTKKPYILKQGLFQYVGPFSRHQALNGSVNLLVPAEAYFRPANTYDGYFQKKLQNRCFIVLNTALKISLKYNVFSVKYKAFSIKYFYKQND